MCDRTCSQSVCFGNHVVKWLSVISNGSCILLWLLSSNLVHIKKFIFPVTRPRRSLFWWVLECFNVLMNNNILFQSVRCVHLSDFRVVWHYVALREAVCDLSLSIVVFFTINSFGSFSANIPRSWSIHSWLHTGRSNWLFQEVANSMLRWWTTVELAYWSYIMKVVGLRMVVVLLGVSSFDITRWKFMICSRILLHWNMVLWRSCSLVDLVSVGCEVLLASAVMNWLSRRVKHLSSWSRWWWAIGVVNSIVSDWSLESWPWLVWVDCVLLYVIIMGLLFLEVGAIDHWHRKLLNSIVDRIIVITLSLLHNDIMTLLSLHLLDIGLDLFKVLFDELLISE